MYRDYFTISLFSVTLLMSDLFKKLVFTFEINKVI